MRSQEVQGRGDAFRCLTNIKNVDGATITTGMGVCFVVSGASIDGVNAVKSTAANQKGFTGIAEEDIPVNGYGVVCVAGFTNSVLISNVGTSITVTAGDTLINAAVAGTFFSSITGQAMSTLLYKYVVTADSATISAAAYVRGIVRAGF